MSNIIGLNIKLFGLEKNIKQSEPTRAANDLGQLGDPAEKERVLNPIVSESYMQKYIEEHGGGGGNIPLCTLTVIAPAGTGSSSSSGWSAFVDNVLRQPVFYEGTNTALLPYVYDEGITLFLALQPDAVFEFSNPVNIDLSDDWPIIIDETQDSSLTLTVTSWGSAG